MKLVRYILFFLLILFGFSSYAQLSSVEFKKLKLKALDLVLRYESSSANTNDDQRDDFVKLFESDEIEILNDVLPDNKIDSKIAVKNYIDLIPSYFKSSLKIRFTPYDIRLSELINQDYFIDIFGIKYISGREEKSQVIYSDSIDITIRLKYNITYKSIKIVDISLNEIPGKYIIVNAVNKKLFDFKPLIYDSLIINNLDYLTDENGNVFLRKLRTNQSIIVSSKSKLLDGFSSFSQSEIDNSILSYTSKNILIAPFHLSIIEISPIYGFHPWSKPPILYENVSNTNIFSFETGLNIGVKLHQKPKGFWKIITGITIFKYHYENEINYILYSYNTTDPDGYLYFRKNE